MTFAAHEIRLPRPSSTRTWPALSGVRHGHRRRRRRADGSDAAPQHEAEPRAKRRTGRRCCRRSRSSSNFAILAGALVYFLKSPIARLSRLARDRRSGRISSPPQRCARRAAAQLAEIEQQAAVAAGGTGRAEGAGAEDVAGRAGAHCAGRRRRARAPLEQTRREIEMRLRVARRELTEHAAQLAVRIAEAAHQADRSRPTISCASSIVTPRS